MLQQNDYLQLQRLWKHLKAIEYNVVKDQFDDFISNQV